MLYGEGWPDWGIDGMANPWRAKAGYGGGMLYDWGVHLVDEILTLVKSKLIGVYGVFQSGVWSTEVEDYFLAILKYENNLICQLEVGNSSLIPLPRWYVIGTKGNIEVKGKNDDNWDEAEVIYIRDNGKKERHNIKLYGVRESGLEGGFYEDLVPFLNGEKKEFVTMYETAEVVKVLDLIKKSSEVNRFLEF
jgi:predicted dehydrogenase